MSTHIVTARYMSTASESLGIFGLNAFNDEIDAMNIDEQIEKTRGIKEIQAESVVYVCSKALLNDFDTSEYSFGYIAGWSNGKDTRELIDNLDVIRKTATTFLVVY